MQRRGLWTELYGSMDSALGFFAHHPLAATVASALLLGCGVVAATKLKQLWPLEKPDPFKPDEDKDPLKQLLPRSEVSWAVWAENLKDRSNLESVERVRSEVVGLMKECRRCLRFGNDAQRMDHGLRGLARILTLPDLSLQREALVQLTECLHYRTHWSERAMEALFEVEGLVSNMLIHDQVPTPLRELAAQSFYMTLEAIWFGLEGRLDETQSAQILKIREHTTFLKHRVQQGAYGKSPSCEFELLLSDQLLKTNTQLSVPTIFKNVKAIVTGQGTEAVAHTTAILMAGGVPNAAREAANRSEALFKLVGEIQGRFATLMNAPDEKLECAGKIRLYLKRLQLDDDEAVASVLQSTRRLMQVMQKKDPLFSLEALDPRRHVTTSVSEWVLAYALADTVCNVASSPLSSSKNREDACDLLKQLLETSRISQVEWRAHVASGRLPEGQEVLKALIKSRETWDTASIDCNNAPTQSLRLYWEARCSIAGPLLQVGYLEGRHRQLKRLTEILLVNPIWDEHAAPVAVLEGHGGSGKSCVVQLFVSQYRRDFDHICILNAESGPDLEDSLEVGLSQIRTEELSFTSLEEWMTCLGETLEDLKTSGKRVLIVVENLESREGDLALPDQARAFARLAQELGTPVILHSQSQSLTNKLLRGTGSPSTNCVPVRTLDKEDAVSLFVRVHDRHVPFDTPQRRFKRAEAEKIVEVIGPVPFVVAVIAAEAHRLGLESLSDFEDSKGIDLLKEFRAIHKENPDYPKATFDKAVERSLDRLTEDRDMALLLSILAVWGVDEVSYSVLGIIYNAFKGWLEFDVETGEWRLIDLTEEELDDLEKRRGSLDLTQYVQEDTSELIAGLLDTCVAHRSYSTDLAKTYVISRPVMQVHLSRMAPRYKNAFETAASALAVFHDHYPLLKFHSEKAADQFVEACVALIDLQEGGLLPTPKRASVQAVKTRRMYFKFNSVRRLIFRRVLRKLRSKSPLVIRDLDEELEARLNIRLDENSRTAIRALTASASAADHLLKYSKTRHPEGEFLSRDPLIGLRAMAADEFLTRLRQILALNIPPCEGVEFTEEHMRALYALSKKADDLLGLIKLDEEYLKKMQAKNKVHKEKAMFKTLQKAIALAGIDLGNHFLSVVKHKTIAKKSLLYLWDAMAEEDSTKPPS